MPASATVKSREVKPTSSKWKGILVGLAAFIIVTPFLNFLFVTKSTALLARNAELEARLLQWETLAQTQQQQQQQQQQYIPIAAQSASPLLVKASSINSYWWPSSGDGGGLLGKIHAVQHPTNCSDPSTKFFVMRSKQDNERDTRGLSAFAHAAGSHMLHALTDGDQFKKYGSRILITDNKLWPMAKGCANGPETRECYFEPLSSCQFSDVDDMHSPNAKVLGDVNEEYDRTTRTIYTSHSMWFRLTNKKYSWTTLPGEDKDHSHRTLLAAGFAYYFRPVEWLRKEIHERLGRSIPIDLNPDRTVGVPIRRSDKCHGHNITGSASGELDCPPLGIYLEGVKKFLKFDPLIENIIVTSEDKSACDEFLVLVNKELPTLRVVLNVGDVQQGTGSGNKIDAYMEGATNANVIASALTSMHMHMRARYFIITSKSTWTSTIAIMAREYGFASEVSVIDIGRNTNTFSNIARSGCEDGVRSKTVTNW